QNWKGLSLRLRRMFNPVTTRLATMRIRALVPKNAVPRITYPAFSLPALRAVGRMLPVSEKSTRSSRYSWPSIQDLQAAMISLTSGPLRSPMNFKKTISGGSYLTTCRPTLNSSRISPPRGSSYLARRSLRRIPEAVPVRAHLLFGADHVPDLDLIHPAVGRAHRIEAIPPEPHRLLVRRLHPRERLFGHEAAAG